MRAYVAAKLALALVMSALVIAVIYLLGWSLEARMDGTAWALTYVIAVVSVVIPSLLGLVVGMLVGSEDAYGLVGGGMSLLGFLSGMFIPLDQLGKVFQTIAKFTPLWGINVAATGPLDGWKQWSWEPAVNIAVWTIALVALCILAAGRITRR
ncbi:MAG: ABC transporter permease [Actinomycetaceae bacterium]|nr:ABC transporter permease [Actinomycetaceae bacterium]MDU0969847.1 ABC transporter permease [Actinomycetaceae bacterium]